MNKVIILLGPTGVGKTGVSILLARELKTEIISADSMQIYRHMDIGTAKPAPEERALIRHHMIDIADPWESFSTGKYIAAVVPVIEHLHRNGKIPVLVGGTGLYIKAMTRGIFSGPSADWKLRQEFLSMEKEEEGSLYYYLKELDPEAALKITPKDIRRIIRAIEVCLKSNIRISDMQKNLTQPLPYEFIKIGITRDRKELYRMIEDRVDEMIKIGLIDEVKRLTNLLKETETRRHGNAEKEKFTDLPIHRFADSPFPSMQAIGYKEIAMCLHGEISLDEAVMVIKRDTKRYAKRQFTWFRKEEHIQWVDITGVQDSNEVFTRVLNTLKTKL
ncbi:MAG: tRNA (adenosine(37)-N6)-dimethylallyltransferase MiaA [Nitrospira sp.]|nr:tRNA (adenosine(37)-N6)-dimethylallyltransferase MiaA [Nitrospira sp.]